MGLSPVEQVCRNWAGPCLEICEWCRGPPDPAHPSREEVAERWRRQFERAPSAIPEARDE
jgi:hypothetical protein